MGDGTNFVVTFAGELLAKAEELIMLVVLSLLSHLQGVHVNDIITGYEKAYEVANKALDGMCGMLFSWKISPPSRSRTCATWTW